MNQLRRLWNWLFGPRCCCCGCRGATRQRMNTAYVNDESNFTIQCDECMVATEQHWKDMWEEHWRNVL